MRIRFTISARLIIGFSILAVAVLSFSVFIYRTLNSSLAINERVEKIHTPSVYTLNDLYILVNQSEMLIKNWVFVDKKNTTSKDKLIKLHKNDIPSIIDSLNKLSREWDIKYKVKFDTISLMITDSLIPMHKRIMNQYFTFDAEDEFMIQAELGDNGSVIEYTKYILSKLRILLDENKEFSKIEKEKLLNKFKTFKVSIVIISTITLIVALITAMLTINSLVTPIYNLRNMLINMGEGILPKVKEIDRTDEIGEMENALYILSENMRKTIDFSIEIGKGNFSTNFTPLSSNDDLGNSLLNMRENLIKAHEEEDKRKREEEERHWFSKGIAQFSEVLRNYNSDFTELSYRIVTELVKYIGANQAGVFVLNDDDESDNYLELIGSFAYERRKFANRKVSLGEGLVGACFKEKSSIYLTDVPNGYLYITSGLGRANPKFLLLVPIKVNEQVFGVLEVASFDEIANVKKEFVEKIAENLASTISYMKVNIHTAKLLHESQQKSKMLIEQEETMRENMQSLAENQGKVDLKLRNLESFFAAIETNIFLIEFSIEGKVSKVNEKILKIFDIKVDEIVGKNLRDLIIDLHIDKYQTVIDKIIEGHNGDLSIKWTTNNLKTIQIPLTIFPLLDNDEGFIYKFIGIANLFYESSIR